MDDSTPTTHIWGSHREVAGSSSTDSISEHRRRKPMRVEGLTDQDIETVPTGSASQPAATNDGDAVDAADGDATDSSDGDAADSSDGDATDSSDGDATDSSDGGAADSSDGDASDAADADAHDA